MQSYGYLHLEVDSRLPRRHPYNVILSNRSYARLCQKVTNRNMFAGVTFSNSYQIARYRDSENMYFQYRRVRQHSLVYTILNKHTSASCSWWYSDAELLSHARSIIFKYNPFSSLHLQQKTDLLGRFSYLLHEAQASKYRLRFPAPALLKTQDRTRKAHFNADKMGSGPDDLTTISASSSQSIAREPIHRSGIYHKWSCLSTIF